MVTLRRSRGILAHANGSTEGSGVEPQYQGLAGDSWVSQAQSRTNGQYPPSKQPRYHYRGFLMLPCPLKDYNLLCYS